MEEGEAPGQQATGAASRPLQPDEEAHGRILARIEPVAPAVRFEQLELDRDTLTRLQLENFAGSEWETTKRRLWLYAYRTLPAKIVTGEVFCLCRDGGLPAARDLQAPSPPMSYEDAVDLVVDVIEVALPSFKRRLMDGKWDPYREDVT